MHLNLKSVPPVSGLPHSLPPLLHSPPLPGTPPTFLSGAVLKQVCVIAIPKAGMAGNSPAKPTFGMTPTMEHNL